MARSEDVRCASRLLQCVKAGGNAERMRRCFCLCLSTYQAMVRLSTIRHSNNVKTNGPGMPNNKRNRKTHKSVQRVP